MNVLLFSYQQHMQKYQDSNTEDITSLSEDVIIIQKSDKVETK